MLSAEDVCNNEVGIVKEAVASTSFSEADHSFKLSTCKQPVARLMPWSEGSHMRKGSRVTQIVAGQV